MAAKYRITVDGNGRYWAQKKIWLWWCDLSFGPSETIDMANSSIETDRSFDRRKERTPLEDQRKGLPPPTRPAPPMPPIKPVIPQPTPERRR